MSPSPGLSTRECWPSSPLKYVTSLLNRGSAPNYVDDGPVRAISQAANQPTGIDWTKTRCHDYRGDLTKLKGLLKPSDIIINSTGTGTLGRVGFFHGPSDGSPCMADSHITVIRFETDHVEPRFAYYWLNSKPFQEYIYTALAVGATNQIELNRERLAGTPIPLPPVPEQRRIAQFLDAETARIDHLIALRRRQLDLSIEEISARAVHATGRVIIRQGAQPSTRTVVPLRRAARSVQTGSTPADLQDYTPYGPQNFRPWYTPAALYGILSVGQAEKAIPLDQESDVPTFPAGSILITGIGESLGKIGYLDHTATGNQQLTAIQPQSNTDGRFLAWQLWAAHQEIREWAQYSRIRIINNDTLKSFPIYLPSLSDQIAKRKELDGYRQKFEDLNKLVGHFSKRITERRQAVITAAVTGQIDVWTAGRRGLDH
ncbi:restriction endonuclease subunit S [Micromonospora carbonacea]|uniref:Type I restriction enzyme, S subunit n=1 Tax=Micromonospora carbonacea TaxID=47853 RepID=A0A1C5AS14_9ACTN|nr:type I restriction enzyme, S subunit [Micromonospora carbonacea]